MTNRNSVACHITSALDFQQGRLCNADLSRLMLSVKSQTLKHFIMKLFELKVELKAKLELAIIIPPTLSPTEAWGGVGPLVTRGGLERSYFCVTGQGSKPRPRPGLPALTSPTLMASIHQKSQRKTLPHSRCRTVHHQEPQAAVGYRMGGMNTANSTLAFSSSFTSNSFMMKCLETFFAGNTKEMHQSLKLVSVHYRNKAWIKNIGVHSF